MTYKVVGKSVPRIDAYAKVTGKARFVADFHMPGMLYGKVLRSPVAHANIKRIDTSKAKALPGVKAVITWEDVPRIPYCTAGHPYPDSSRRDTYILDKKVRFMGDAVAAVAAETREIAEDALKLIEVEYEELPVYTSPEDAMAEGAVEIHEGTKNICGHHEFEQGDLEAGFAASDYVFEEEFKTPIIAHCSLETHISLAYLDENERLVVKTSTQVPFNLRRIMSQALDMSMKQIRIIKPHVGGGFGAKAEVVQEPINAVLTLKTKRPVLLEYTREEEMVAGRTRHSTVIKLKTGVTKEGRMLAQSMKIISNTGAYAGHGHAVVYSISSHFVVHYPTPHFSFEGISVYTNIPVASAMRSYGASQLNFAMESHMDNMARKLGIDPLEFRRINVMKEGEKDPMGYFSNNSYGIADCLAKGEELSSWKTKRETFTDTSTGKKRKRGIGMACYSYETTAYCGAEEMSGAIIRMNEDGTAVLYLGSAELGQGNDTAMAQIAAEELSIDVKDIHVVAVDTDVSPYDIGAYASRQLYMCGMAVKKAAVQCREMIVDFAAQLFNTIPANLEVRDGWIYDKLSGNRLITVKETVWKAHYNMDNPRTIVAQAYHGAKCNPLSHGAVFAEVEVDTATGKVDIVKLWSVHDCGKVVNPQLAEGQVHGGVLMGIGFGLSEQLLIDPKTGRTYNDNLLDYKMATMMDTPELEVAFVETNEPSGAYGNKSLGEPPCISVAPAIRNAVLNATGVEFNEAPLTPERVLMKLKKAVKA
ncbi:MAG: xanthine dehydrogenase molybdenum-binding subunit XdhA [Clostridia bacterium]|nr:xanthine dehydrogenase molybdenum-binding subunit XdhA [Clostridia bacterium]